MKALTQHQYLEFKRRNNAISQSDVKAILSNARQWKRGTKNEQTEPMVFGSAYDCLLLTPDQFDSEFPTLPFDDMKSSSAKAWASERSDKTILRRKRTAKCVYVEDVKDAVAATLNNQELEHITRLIPRSQTQLIHAGKAWGRMLCAKYDLVPPLESEFGDWLIDVKTTARLERDYGRTIANFGYHLQGAWYLDLYNAVTGEKRTRFGHLIHSRDTGDQSFVELDPEAIAIGRDEYLAGLGKLNKCEELGRYPGVFEPGELVGLPGWYKGAA